MAKEKVFVPHDPTVITKQAPRDGTSVEAQLRAYRDAGLVPAGGAQPRYGDFTGIGDFHTELNRVRECERQFAALPAEVRKVAENDPGLFLEMVYGEKPEMLAALEKAGLRKAQLPEQVVKVEVVNQPGATSESSAVGSEAAASERSA